jgi:hypothetical protein
MAAARDGRGALAVLRSMRAASAAARAAGGAAAASSSPSPAPLPATAPDARSVSHTVRALVRCGRRSDAMALFRSLDRGGAALTADSAAALLDACEADAAWADGVAVWKAATGAGGAAGAADASSPLLAAGRRLVYAFPGLLSALPPSLVGAARAAVEGGAAARALLARTVAVEDDE